MLKANELRIGNFILSMSAVCKVTPKHISQFYDYPDNVGIFYSPIPLTDEWLTKFGFEGDSIKQMNEDGITFQYNTLDNFMFINDHLMLPGTIQYVHQLQNLYFALTEKELTFKQ